MLGCNYSADPFTWSPRPPLSKWAAIPSGTCCILKWILDLPSLKDGTTIELTFGAQRAEGCLALRKEAS